MKKWNRGEKDGKDALGWRQGRQIVTFEDGHVAGAWGGGW